jgi:hypothetical protein
VDFFDAGALAGAVCGLLAGKASERMALGRRARDAVVSRFDLATICLPGQMDWVLGLAGPATAAGEPAAPELQTAAPDDASEVRIAEAVATAEVAVPDVGAVPARKSPAKTRSPSAPAGTAATTRKKKSRSGRQAAR